MMEGANLQRSTVDMMPETGEYAAIADSQ